MAKCRHFERPAPWRETTRARKPASIEWPGSLASQRSDSHWPIGAGRDCHDRDWCDLGSASNRGLERFAKILYIPIWQLAWSYQDQRHHLENSQEVIEIARLAGNTKSAAAMRTKETALESRTSNAGPYDRCRYLFSMTSLPTLRAAS